MRYYIWDMRSTVGNCALWWGPNGGGYVCDLREAGLYEKDEAMKIARCRGTDVAVPEHLARSIARQHVRADGELQRALEAATRQVPMEPAERVSPELKAKAQAVRDEWKRWNETPDQILPPALINAIDTLCEACGVSMADME